MSLVKEILSFSWCFSVVLMNYGAVWADSGTNWSKINEICGVSYADRIVGGTKAEVGQFPWIAHLGILRKFRAMFVRSFTTFSSRCRQRWARKVNSELWMRWSAHSSVVCPYSRPLRGWPWGWRGIVSKTITHFIITLSTLLLQSRRETWRAQPQHSDRLRARTVRWSAASYLYKNHHRAQGVRWFHSQTRLGFNWVVRAGEYHAICESSLSAHGRPAAEVAFAGNRRSGRVGLVWHRRPQIVARPSVCDASRGAAWQVSKDPTAEAVQFRRRTNLRGWSRGKR